MALVYVDITAKLIPGMNRSEVSAQHRFHLHIKLPTAVAYPRPH